MKAPTSDGHSRIEWAKVRKRAVLGQLDYSDHQKANRWQLAVIRQIELAVQSVDMDDLSDLEE